MTAKEWIVKGGTCVAEVTGETHRHVAIFDSRDDARLAAQSPQMLRALVGFLNGFDEHPSTCPRRECELCDWLARASAIVEAATGGDAAFNAPISCDDHEDDDCGGTRCADCGRCPVHALPFE